MGLESATFISSLVASNPDATDNQSQGDDHIRLIKSALQATLPNASKAFRFPDFAAKTANFSVLSTDQNKLFSVDATAGAVTATLPSLVAGDAGWCCTILKIDAGANAVIVAPASGTINGAATINTTVQNFAYLLWWTGSTWYALSLTPNVASVSSLPWTSISLTAAASLTSVDKADILPGYDVSATQNVKWTVEELFKSIHSLTEETVIQSTLDYFLLFDFSAGTARKIKPANALAGTTIAAATQAEMEANASTTVYASPGRMKYHPAVPKVWACISGGASPSLVASFGVSSITDLGAGLVRVNFATVFSSVNYAVLATIERSSTSLSSNADREIVNVHSGSKTTSSVTLECLDGTDGGPNRVDPDSWFIAIYGDQ